MTLALPVLHTKLFVPTPRANLVARPRLLASLNQGLSGKMTLVSTGAGFGKSTLISQWAKQSNRRVAWLSLDEGDADPVRFLTYLIAALQTVVKHIGDDALAALQSPQLPSPVGVLNSLINEIAHVEDAIALVLDDYHLVDSSVVHQALDHLLTHLPTQLHVIIASRVDPPLSLARMRVAGQLNEIRVDDLRFSSNEAEEFLKRAMKLHLAKDEMDALGSRTEGWISGLQLAAISLQRQNDSRNFIQSFSGSHQHVTDYLMEEVLQRQPENVQQFLLYTSILQRFCGSLCDAVLNNESASGQLLLETIDRANLFVIPLDNERRWYRYHHLFSEFLRQRLAQIFGDETLVQLHKRASAWFLNNALEFEALEHAIASRDLDYTLRIVKGNGVPLYFRGAGRQVLNWLTEIPRNIKDSHAELWVMYATASSLMGLNNGVEEKLLAAESSLQGIPEDETVRDLIGQIAGLRAVQAALIGDIPNIFCYSERALTYLSPKNLPVRSATNWKLGLAYVFMGDRAKAKATFQTAINEAVASGNIFAAILSTTNYAHLLEQEARLYPALECYQRILAWVGEPQQPVACEANIGLARLSYQWNDISSAQIYAQKGATLAAQVEKIDCPISCDLFYARLNLTFGDVKSAINSLQKAEAFLVENRYFHRMVELTNMRVLCLIHAGDIRQAEEIIQANPNPYGQARVYFAKRAYSTALKILAAFLTQIVQDADARQRLDAMILMALCYQLMGDVVSALKTIADALRLAEPSGYVRAFVDEGDTMRILLNGARNSQITTSYVDKLLAAFVSETANNAAHGGSNKSNNGLVELLSDRELQVLTLIAEGLSNQEISNKLYVTLSTIKGHNLRIFEKLQVQRRTEAVAVAKEYGLI